MTAGAAIAGRVGHYPVLALGLLMLTDQLAGQTLAVLAPDLMAALGIATAAYSSLLAVQLVAMGLAPFATAALIRGRRIRAALSIGTGFVWSGAMVAIAFVHDFGTLAALLALNGIANGAVIALHTPLLADTYPESRLARAITIYGAAAPAASVLGPLVVAGLTGWLGMDWRAVFLTIGTVATAGCIVAIRLRDPGIGGRPETPRRASVRAAFGALLRVPTIRRVMLGFVAYGVLVIPGATFLAVHLDQRWSMAADARGLFMACCFAGVILVLLGLGGRLDGVLAARPGAGPLILAGLLLGSAVCLTVGVLAGAQAVTLGAFFLTLLATGLALPMMYVVVLSVSDPLDRSFATSLGALALATGGVLGALLLGVIEAAFGSSGAVASIAVPGVLAGLVIATAARTIENDLYVPEETS